MPKGKNHTPEQIVAILRRLESGGTADAVCRSVNISEATLYRCKRPAKYLRTALDSDLTVRATTRTAA
jgi:hypothetical protein